MEITDLLSATDWAQFEKELFKRFHLNSTIYNASGIGVTGTPNWCNNLCPKIKGNKESLAAICAAGNQHFMAQAKQTKKTVIGECDAGLIKIAVPVLINAEFLGTAGGCGRLPDGGEADIFLIHKASGLSENEINELCRGLEPMTKDQAEQMASFVEDRIAQYVNNYIGNS